MATPTPARCEPAVYEQLGALFLGRTDAGPLLYDSPDLTTHAAILGMTGSGKTGLGIALLEECALDGIPAIIIDPKGDLGNLALTFPDLSAAEFAPWCDNATSAESAATTWRAGLAEWGQGPQRIARLRAAAAVSVYTPGSQAGLPLALLGSLAPPVTTDAEARQARLSALTGSLLGLVGIDADPLASREHILVSAVLARAWAAEETIDLGELIRRVQDPAASGLKRLGALDIETMFPAAARLALALRLNQLLASPAFAGWLTGEPLDTGTLLYTADGRPRLTVISTAHLPEHERMLVTTLILADVLAWMRTQPGTGTLRAVLYIDEIAGYVPPVANPPSKPALMTLLKQARAFGVGVVLASQNPADLDYKALSNIGTWWIGRLQTERDRSKVMQAFADDAQAERIAALLPTLGKRVFLQHNVHDSAPVVFTTRWTMSYLRGPMTTADLSRLRGAAKVVTPLSTGDAAEDAAEGASSSRPVLPAEVPQWFIPSRGRPGTVVCTAHALGSARVTFRDAKAAVDLTQDVLLLAPLTDAAVAVDWFTAADSEIAEITEADLAKRPEAKSRFADLPITVTARSVAAWTTSFGDALYRTQRLDLLRSPASGAISSTGEDERAFRIRLTDEGRAARDTAVTALRARYASKLTALEERLRKARATEDKERAQATSATFDSALSIGASLLGAFFGRKALSAANAGRVATSSRAVGRTLRERGDVERAQDTVATLTTQIQTLDDEFTAAVTALEQRQDPRLETFTKLTLVPKKSDITIRLVGLAWVPQLQIRN